MDGKPIKMVLQWLLRREDLIDAEIATAINMPTTTFSRRKDAEDFPSYEELGKIGQHFEVSPMMLQVAFGHIGPEALVLLDGAGMRQYLEQGGGNHPHSPLEVCHPHVSAPGGDGKPKPPRFKPREDAPPM